MLAWLPFIMGIVVAGSIDSALWGTSRDSLSWSQKWQWACDIAEGMQFIHQQGFAHRDLKSKNVLYDRATMRAKVTGCSPHDGVVWIWLCNIISCLICRLWDGSAV